MPNVKVNYYTDPACPWSWALEPWLRKLMTEFEESVQITYLMAGMAREFGDPVSLVREALEASAESGMPVDTRLWLDEPPRSSHPACIAVKAAAEQGDPARFLRALREGFMCRRRRLDGAEALVQEAREAGLDVARFRIDLGSHAILEAFGADLERAKAAAQEGERVPLPTLEFEGGPGVYGPAPYERIREAAVAAGASPVERAAPGIEEALRRFGTMSAAELAAVCDLPGPRAQAELWRLASEWRIRPERLGSGELWSIA